MVVGFVLISTEPSKEQEIFRTLQKIEGITEIHPLFGEYDLIAKVEAENFSELSEIIVERIRKVEGIKNTKTLTGAIFK